MTTKPIFLLKTLALIVCSAPFSSWTVFGQEKTRPEIAPSFMQTADQKDGNDSDGPHADYMDILGRGGLISMLGDGHTNALVERLAADPQRFIQILDCNPVRVEQRREDLARSGHLGRVTVKTLYNSALPYPEHFVNALVVFNDQGVSRDEMTRVLAPGGVLLLLNGQEKILERWIKPWPSVMDDWPQSGHGPGNNAVSSDELVGPPRRLRWDAPPRWTTHHERLSGFPAAVSAGGRFFYIVEDAARFSLLVPRNWQLVARDAFNGTLLWKIPIEKWLDKHFTLKAGPATLPARLATDGDFLYTALSIDGPVVQIDCLSGKIIQTYAETAEMVEMRLQKDTLFLVTNLAGNDNGKLLTGVAKRKIMALKTNNGEAIWSREEEVVPGSLAVNDAIAVFSNGKCLVALNSGDGEVLWISDPLPHPAMFKSWFAPGVILYKDIVVFAGGEKTGEGGPDAKQPADDDTMTGLDAKTGKVLWTAPHPPGGYMSPEGTLIIDGEVWTSDTFSGDFVPDSPTKGMLAAYDVRTGKQTKRFLPDKNPYWFHHRCYPPKATKSFLIFSSTGVEFIDPKSGTWDVNHWTRGSCLFGVLPANGLLYCPPNPCSCYKEALLHGLNALAPEAPENIPSIPDDRRLIKGPAYGTSSGATASSDADWPTFRGNNARTGSSAAPVTGDLAIRWNERIGRNLSAPIVADGKVIVADTDAHQLIALDANTGDVLWRFHADGRIDSPPSWHSGGLLFGTRAGTLYRLDAATGSLAWRFQTSPVDMQVFSHGQLESSWPLPGATLIRDGKVHVIAGRSRFLDGGLRYWCLDAITGEIAGKNILNEIDPATGENFQFGISSLEMPAAMNDILAAKDEHLFLRSLPLDFNGRIIQNRKNISHLYNPGGYLDDSFFHRVYWTHDSTSSSTMGGFGRGTLSPSGRLLAADENAVYGYGRKPEYFAWTAALEYHLFKAPLDKNGWPIRKNSESEKAIFLHKSRYAMSWTCEIPIHVRAMALTPRTLYIAGTPELHREGGVRMYHMDDPGQDKARKILAAWNGDQGADLLAVSTETGDIRQTIKLQQVPRFDGLAAAAGRIYLVTNDGCVICLGP